MCLHCLCRAKGFWIILGSWETANNLKYCSNWNLTSWISFTFVKSHENCGHLILCLVRLLWGSAFFLCWPPLSPSSLISSISFMILPLWQVWESPEPPWPHPQEAGQIPGVHQLPPAGPGALNPGPQHLLHPGLRAEPDWGPHQRRGELPQGPGH